MRNHEHEGESESGARAPGSNPLPWVISIAIHVAFVVGAFFVVWTIMHPAPPERAQVIVSFDNPAPAPIATELLDVQLLSTSPAAPEPEEVDPIEPLLSDLMIEREARSNPLLTRPATSSEQMREMIHQRSVPNVRFAGLGASNAIDIVYVVDASGSMISAYPQIIAELERSVRRLEPSQRFQVIVFGPGAEGYLAAHLPGEPDRTTRLVRATSDNLDHVLEWARGLLASGRSNPIAALEMALSLDPDAVFVLSSSITGLGVWEPDRDELLAQIDLLNPIDARTGRRAVVIKTIQVLETDPAGILRAIGRTHGGEDGYNFISREELLSR